MKRITPFILAMLLGTTASAAQNTGSQPKIYLGGGLTFNSLASSGNARGLQLIAGVEFDKKINNDITTAVEIGYMDTGDFDGPGFFGGNASSANGVWASLVESVAVTNKADMLVRIGFDAGDDDGLMVGAGMGYNFNRQMSFRSEYVVRDNINSFQFNVIVHL